MSTTTAPPPLPVDTDTDTTTTTTSITTTFNPLDPHPPHDDVESPSLSSSNALARFEFEASSFSSGGGGGRGGGGTQQRSSSKEGTKVLMVEWEEDTFTKSIPGDWEISWEGKKTVLPARGGDGGGRSENGNGSASGMVNRLYFLLGPGLGVPPTVKLSKGDGAVIWRTNPLPAIFSPELGMSATQAGKKGVLHTIWAKKRLQVLRSEIEREKDANVEGIALEMAMAEMEWIESNFGVVAKPSSSSAAAAGLGISSASSPPPSSSSTMNRGVAGGLNSPTSPRSPGGGRLMEKLKGLKIGTSERELSSPPVRAGNDALPPPPPPPPAAYNPLSPESDDVAVGSFGSFAALKGMAPPSSTLAAKPAQPPARQIVAQRPPESFAAQQRQQAGGNGGGGGMGSLNAFASPTAVVQGDDNDGDDDDDDDDDLFALPMSPRSPEMSKSPFSFAVQDTIKYAAAAADGERSVVEERKV